MVKKTHIFCANTTICMMIITLPPPHLPPSHINYANLKFALWIMKINISLYCENADVANAESSLVSTLEDEACWKVNISFSLFSTSYRCWYWIRHVKGGSSEKILIVSNNNESPKKSVLFWKKKQLFFSSLDFLSLCFFC